MRFNDFLILITVLLSLPLFFLSTFYFLLSTFYFPLSTFHFPLSTFHFLLSTFYFLLSFFPQLVDCLVSGVEDCLGKSLREGGMGMYGCRYVLYRQLCVYAQEPFVHEVGSMGPDYMDSYQAAVSVNDNFHETVSFTQRLGLSACREEKFACPKLHPLLGGLVLRNACNCDLRENEHALWNKVCVYGAFLSHYLFDNPHALVGSRMSQHDLSVDISYCIYPVEAGHESSVYGYALSVEFDASLLEPESLEIGFSSTRKENRFGFNCRLALLSFEAYDENPVLLFDFFGSGLCHYGHSAALEHRRQSL